MTRLRAIDRIEILPMTSRICRRLSCLLVWHLIAPVAAQKNGPEPVISPDRAASLRAEIERRLDAEMFGHWYPAMLDRERGGFHENAARDWSLRPDRGASAVYQSRLTWTAAALAQFNPARRDEALAAARHGLDFIDRSLRDTELGGFYWQIGPDGRPPADLRAPKHLYGMSFVIYAASRLRLAGGDDKALRVARDAFDWLEAHAHDAEHGGYFESFARDGSILRPDPQVPDARDVLGNTYGNKSMNAHIHMLEALAELARVDERPIVRERLREVFEIVRDRIAHAPGALHLYLEPDWTPIPGHDSYGHDVETAYLLREAAEVLGLEHDERTEAVARSLVDHPLAVGWDQELGGFYDNGDDTHPHADTRKVWWTEAEGLNALLLMHRLHGRETDRYARAFLTLWDFTRLHLIDPEHGGWYESSTREGQLIGDGTKAQPWKANYHHTRALMNLSRMLRAMETKPGGPTP
jgi:mannobiose 2-epimerase